MVAHKSKPKIPDAVGRLKLPGAALDEIASAIETYSAFKENKSPTGAEKRKNFNEIHRLAGALKASLEELSFIEGMTLLEATGENFPHVPGSDTAEVVACGIADLVSRQAALSEAAAAASTSVRNSKPGADSSHVDFLVAFLDDLLVRHTSERLTGSKSHLSFVIEVFRNADHELAVNEKASERSIKDALLELANGRSKAPPNSATFE